MRVNYAARDAKPCSACEPEHCILLVVTDVRISDRATDPIVYRLADDDADRYSIYESAIHPTREAAEAEVSDE